MKLTLDIDPPKCTAQHKGERVVAGRWVQHYEKRPQKRARLAYEAAIRQALKSSPKDYDTVDEWGEYIPLEVAISFVFKAKRKKDIGQPKTTRPDVDNMAKGLLDVLTRLHLLADDAQIAALAITKSYGAEAKVVIGIEPWRPFDRGSKYDGLHT